MCHAGTYNTTLVYHDTKFKFYLDAPVEKRALRRNRQLIQKDEKISFEKVA
jgi:cytidylate kinase